MAYALAERDAAIAFAISFEPEADSAVFSFDPAQRPPRIRLKNTRVLWRKPGYVYKVLVDGFVQVDDWQWVCSVAVSPVGVEEINPLDYRHWIEHI